MSIFFTATSLADYRSRNTQMGFTDNSAEIGPYVLEGLSQGDGAITSGIFPPFAYGLADDELWLHFYLGSAGGSGHDVELRILDSLGNNVYRVTFDEGAASGLIIDIWNGSAWQNFINTNTDPRDETVDIQFVNGATTGAVRLYINQVLDVEVTGVNTDLSTVTDIGGIEHQAPSTSGGDGFFISDIIIADEDTRGWLFVQENQSGEVLNTLGSGGFAEVNDRPGINIDDFAVADADGQKLTLAGTFDSVIDTAHEIVAVVTSVNYNRIGNTVSGLKALDVISSTEYTSAEVSADEGVGVMQFIQDVSPATGVAWTPAEVQASEAGVESA